MTFLIFLSQMMFSYPLTCLDENRIPISNSNSLVNNLKENTENQYEARALIEGLFLGIRKQSNKHITFEVDLDEDLKTVSDRIDVVYNEKFGSFPNNIEAGARVKACGDYITATRNENGHEASPNKAIIHWTHFSSNPKSHYHGYLFINGQLISTKEK